MKIAYGTYAMPTVALEDAIPALADIGYDGVEICIGERHIGSMPSELTPDRRKQLKQLLTQHELGIPAFYVSGAHTLELDDAQHQTNLEHVRRVAQLGHELEAVGAWGGPVVSLGIGGKSDQWEHIKHDIVRRLNDYAAMAVEENVLVAAEAHSGAAVDRTERALWVIEQVDSPLVKLHFDIVHTFLAGERVQDSVRDLVPITGHTHITDAHIYPDGSRDLLLLGQGQLDTVGYLKAMHKAGWTDFITLEVSGMVWGRDDYDPIAAAVFSYQTIDRAFGEAGVPRE